MPPGGGHFYFVFIIHNGQYKGIPLRFLAKKRVFRKIKCWGQSAGNAVDYILFGQNFRLYHFSLLLRIIRAEDFTYFCQPSSFFGPVLLGCLFLFCYLQGKWFAGRPSGRLSPRQLPKSKPPSRRGPGWRIHYILLAVKPWYTCVSHTSFHIITTPHYSDSSLSTVYRWSFWQ